MHTDLPLVETEDCLLLDIYAPVDAFKPGAKPLPVIVWFFGGAFAYGSKNFGGPLCSGQSILKAPGYKAIFIVGNYRVGAFGWLAGNYMQQVGTPNAGLHDQALLLQWVQDHAHKVGGDEDRVSAWGHCAGGGSIMHHLIREDGERNPLFNSFVAWSPGFEWAWDNTVDGELDLIYKDFSRLAGCSGRYDIECLRGLDFKDLTEANRELFKKATAAGVFPVGPAVDGTWVKTMPPVALFQGKHWKGIDGAIVSHTTNETSSFVPKHINHKTAFETLLGIFLPGHILDKERADILDQYDCVGKFNSDYKTCMDGLVEHLVFTCNTRFLIDAFPQKTYAMQHAFPDKEHAIHGSDMVPLFSNQDSETKALLSQANLTWWQKTQHIVVSEVTFSSRYKKFFASFAVSGDPNKDEST
ncbi:Lipase 1 [Escovopsis weberi]|uniref:Lipase 1 n=1 Tax=Escovopsis weberi TaxID=150374 RepID=A0A0M8MSD4_ESCWE|nr:Lipase 1 [Escovopsis weberi]